MAYRIGKCLLSDRLRENGMTQAELARRLGIERQQVNKWVKGHQRMSLETSKNVATTLNLHIDDLFEWIPSRD